MKGLRCQVVESNKVIADQHLFIFCLLNIMNWFLRPFLKKDNCRLWLLDAEFPPMVTGFKKKNFLKLI